MSESLPDEVPAVVPDRPGRHATLVATGILLSRLAGFARQRAVGHFFGVSAVTDAFGVAFRIPNLLQNLLGEGTLSASFIPVYSRLLGEGRDEEAGRVAGAVAGLLTVASAAAVLVMVVLADPVVSLIAPGLPERTHDLAVSLMRVITPGVGLLVLSSWALGILNSHRRFFLAYVAPVLWNVAQIAFLVGAALLVLDTPFTPGTASAADLDRLVHALAIGTVVGGALQLFVQLPLVRRLDPGLRLSLDVRQPGVRRVFSAFGPVVVGRGVVQLSAYLDVVLASLLASGAVAALVNAQQLYILPVSLFGLSVAAAELPSLARLGPGTHQEVADRVGVGLRRVAVFVVPTVVAYLLIGDILVGALYRTGAFGRTDELLVWLVLAGFSLGLIATTASRLLQSVLYAVEDTRTPARYAILRVGLAAVLGVLLMLQLDRLVIDNGMIRNLGGLPTLVPLSAAQRAGDGVLHLGAVGLAVGSGVSAWLEWALLRRAVQRRFGIRVGLASHTRAIAMAAGVAAVVAVAVRPLVAGWHPLLAAIVVVPAVAGSYLLAARRAGVPEVVSLLRRDRS